MLKLLSSGKKRFFPLAKVLKWVSASTASFPISVFLILSMVGCGSEAPTTKVATNTGNEGRGAVYLPAPIGYTQTELFIPEVLNDPYLQSTGAWNALVFDLWSWLDLNAAPSYLTLSLPEREIVVAIIDTGVDYDHPDLRGRVWLNSGEKGSGKENNGIDDDGNGYVDDFMGWNWVTGNNNPVDDAGHGTHVAGTVAAIGGNSLGVVGVAPWVRVMPLKVCDNRGRCDTSDIRAAMDYAVQNGASIINLSLGGSYDDQDYQDFSASIHDATVHGTTVVVAAGNERSDVLNSLPASADGAIAVGAHANDRELCYTFSNTGWRLDLSAPGCGFNGISEVSGILSLNSKKCGASGKDSCCSRVVGGDYCLLKGTSMSAPHVAGLFAIAKTAEPTASPYMLREAVLTATAASASMQKGEKHEDYGQGLASVPGLQLFAAKAPALKFLSPKFGESGVLHHLDIYAEARAEPLIVEIRARKITAGMVSMNLTTGDIIHAATNLAPLEVQNIQFDFAPAEAGDYLIIVEGKSTIAGSEQKFFDTHLLRR